MTEIGLKIERATASDLSEILQVQYLAFHSEAEIYDDFSLPPLTQNLTEMYVEHLQKLILKATIDGRIVGSVRAREEGGTCYIGRLAVHPEYQNQGIGTQLMIAIEQKFREARRFEIFTGHKSVKSLHLYHKLGYREFQNSRVHAQLNLIYLEKANLAL